MANNFRLARRVPQNPPPVAKKPSLQERQKHFQLRPPMDRQQLPMPHPAPPPPIGYNDADRFYVASPLPSENSLELDHELEVYPQKLSAQSANEPTTSAWLSKKLHKMDTRGGERRRDASKTPRNAHTDTKDLMNDEEHQRRRLEEQVGDLKVENRIKSRELKTNKYIENEMNRKLKTADDAYVLRHTVKDKDRLLSHQEKIISDLTIENAKLAENLAERDRQVFELQSEVDNLERVIVAKKALREAERLQEIGEDLDKTRDELAGAKFEIEAAKNELKNVQSVVNRKDREIKTKNEQIEQLTKQLAQAQTQIAGLENEKAVADNHSKAANREAKLLKEQNEKLVDFKERCHNLEEENSYMAEAIRTLEAKVLQLETIKRDKEVLDDLVQDFKSALKDKNQIAKDKCKLIAEAQQLKDMLREKIVDEEALQKEVEKLKDVLNELEKENNFYRDLEVDFRRVKQKYEEVERERFKNELAMAKLKPRVERLQNRCKEKDDLIRRLANELRAGGDRLPRDLLQEADRNQNNAVNDYIDINDYIDDDEPLSAHVRRSRDRRPYNSSQRSPIAAYEPVRGIRKPSSSPTRTYEQDPASSQPQDRFTYSQQQPERHFSNKEVPQTEEIRRVQQQPSQAEPQIDTRGTPRYPNNSNSRNDPNQSVMQDHASSKVPPPTAWEIPRAHSENQEVPPSRSNDDPRTEDAVYEETIRPMKREDDESRKRQTGYDPQWPPTGRSQYPEHYAREEPVKQYPRQAEPIQSTQIGVPVRQEQGQSSGPHNRAEEAQGQKPELVRTNTYPALAQPHDEMIRRQPVAATSRNDINNQQPGQNQPLHSREPMDRPEDQHSEPQRYKQMQQMDPPQNVRARMLDSDNLLVEWDTPTLDELDRSNGVVVAGYKVFVNGAEQQPVVSSRVTRSIVPRSALGSADTSAVRITVQSYNYDGDTSDRANVNQILRPTESPSQQPNRQQQGSTTPLRVEVDIPTEPTSSHHDQNPNHEQNPTHNDQNPSQQDHIPKQEEKGSNQDKTQGHQNQNHVQQEPQKSNPSANQGDNPDNYDQTPENNKDPSQHKPRDPQTDKPAESVDDRFRTRNNSPTGAANRLGPPPQPFVRKALYDYEPSQHSPSTFPSFELELHKGDDVQTFGPVRPDGLYNAEVNGKRGLVPAHYLQLDEQQ